MIIPSMDLMNGRVVQLEQGERLKIERDNGLELAKEFARVGELAVVDLDGAKGEGENRQLIEALCRVAPCRVGGGIRSVDDALFWLGKGAQKVVLGSAVFGDDGSVNLPLVADLSRLVGAGRLVIALDSRKGQIQTRGWRRSVPLGAADALDMLQPYCAEFLYTAVDCEGMMNGVDMETAAILAARSERRLIYAGGVSTAEEIRQLTALGLDVQLGMSLYSGRLSLTEAFIAGLKWNGNGLVPAIALDTSGRILMQAWCNAEALKKTLESGWATYFSRSRQRLWRKGELSGNRQRFLSFRPDCDSDCLSLVVEPAGPACHTGQQSCFGPLPFAWEDLCRVIADRLETPRRESYTASLDDRLVREKLMEEAEEVCAAEGPDELVWEVADLLYFASVIMTRAGVKPAQIWTELERRRRK